MSWHIGETESERLFWAANFSARFEDARVLSQARILSGEIYPDLAGLDSEWRALVMTRQLLAEKEYEAAEFLSSPLLQSTSTYIRVMAGYYRAWAWWGDGKLVDQVTLLGIDSSTSFGRAMAAQMLAWHHRRRFDFPAHVTALQRAVKEFLQCDPIPNYWLAQTLVPLLHTAFEMADEKSAVLGREAFNAMDWREELEHQRFDCLRALSRYAFVTGDTESALKYITRAKCCQLPWSCLAHAFLHSASYGIELGEKTWTKEQLSIAEEMLGSQSRDESCPEYRTTILSLALQYTEVDANRSKLYLSQYHQSQADKNYAATHDHHLDAIANISLGKIGLFLAPGDGYSLKLLEDAYEVAISYGFRYRAAIAASEIAGAQEKRQSKERWMENALAQIKFYGDNSPLQQLLARKLERTHLTQTEQHICDLVVSGKTNKQIADELCVSQGRVANIVSEVCRKYHVRGRPGLLARLR